MRRSSVRFRQAAPFLEQFLPPPPRCGCVVQDQPMARKRRVPPQDAMFLWTETPETMMHVASLMPFTPPAGAGPTYLRDVLEEARHEAIKPPWNMKLTHPFLLR